MSPLKPQLEAKTLSAKIVALIKKFAPKQKVMTLKPDTPLYGQVAGALSSKLAKLQKDLAAIEQKLKKLNAQKIKIALRS